MTWKKCLISKANFEKAVRSLDIIQDKMMVADAWKALQYRQLPKKSYIYTLGVSAFAEAAKRVTPSTCSIKQVSWVLAKGFQF